MSSACLKLLLALALFVIITECRPQRSGGPRKGPRKGSSRKPCEADDECGEGFSCKTGRKGNKVCAKTKAEAAKPSKYKTTYYKEGIERSHRPDVCWCLQPINKILAALLRVMISVIVLVYS